MPRDIKYIIIHEAACPLRKPSGNQFTITDVALGAYALEPGEQAVLLEFGAFVESVRPWGRDQRAELGL